MGLWPGFQSQISLFVVKYLDTQFCVFLPRSSTFLSPWCGFLGYVWRCPSSQPWVPSQNSSETDPEPQEPLPCLHFTLCRLRAGAVGQSLHTWCFSCIRRSPKTCAWEGAASYGHHSPSFPEHPRGHGHPSKLIFSLSLSLWQRTPWVWHCVWLILGVLACLPGHCHGSAETEPGPTESHAGDALWRLTQNRD